MLENDSQMEALKRKQDEVLSGKKYLDVGEETQEMPEPPFYIMLAGLFILIVIFKLRKKKSMK